MQDNILKLIEALETCGITKNLIEEAIHNIQFHQADLIYWGDADKERILLHAFLLGRAKALLQDALATNIKFPGQEIIECHIRKIDEHFSRHQWPTVISENDPVLLKQLWRQKNIEIDLARQSPDYPARKDHIANLKSEGNRILRILLKLPAIASAQGQYEDALTHDLVAALEKSTDFLIKSVIEEELQARYPNACNFLTALYGRRNVAKLDRLINLKKISSEGFLQSMAQSKDALVMLIDNLTIAQNVLGKRNFIKIINHWDTLNKLRFIAILDMRHSGVKFGRYQLDYPLEYSELQMPPWMQDNSAGQLNGEAVGGAGTYILLYDSSVMPLFNEKSREELYEHYVNLQDNLIKPNYDALQLIVTHSDKMTKMTARTILLLLAKMVEAYQKIASRVESDLVFDQYNMIRQKIEAFWEEFSEKDELPNHLKNQIISLNESPLSEIQTVHSLIRFLHEAGNQALEKKMISARADIKIAIGCTESNQTKEIQLAKLDHAPIIANGLIRHRAIAAIVAASRRIPTPVPGTFVVINHHITYSVKLGEHRAEFSANIDHPDQEGFVRLQSYQGGIEIEQQLRGAFVERAMKEKGMMVQCEQEGLVDSLVRGILDKDHGARTYRQIEDAVIFVLKLIGSLRDLDYAMAYIFSQEMFSSHQANRIDANQIDKFAASFAGMFLVEGVIPFLYGGDGMPLATYCEYKGPKILQEFKAYQSNEQRMLRHRLYFSINALLRLIELPVIPPGKGGVGQEVIDEYFNKPLRSGLCRGELRINSKGFVEKNPDYQPIKWIIGQVVSHENEALIIAALLKKTDLFLDFCIIGSVDQLTLMRAQQEIAPDEWLIVYGLADEENRSILYAFIQHLKGRFNKEWLSANGFRKLLHQSGYVAPGKIQLPGFQKVVSHRLLIGQPHELIKIIGTSVRGLSASVGDGSVRIGRITFDRNYYVNRQIQDRRILLVPFTVPEDIEAVRSADAVLVTSGGLLSHAGVTTREFSIPALILPHAEWIQSAQGPIVRLEERHPGEMRKTAEGFWVSDSMVSEIVEVHEGDMVLVWASQGIVSVMPMSDAHLEQIHGLIQGVILGENTASDFEHQLAHILLSVNMQNDWEQIASDVVSLILAEALWDRRINPDTRKQLIDIVEHACAGIDIGGKTVKLPEKSATDINTMVQHLTGNTLTELEGLLSEIEHNISKVNVLWRALIIIAVAERHWSPVETLMSSLKLSTQRLQLIEERINKLRCHPRIALLRASALNEIEFLSSVDLTEEDLPRVWQTLRRLGHKRSKSRRPKVLLVCTANVDRSPMAEFLFRKMLLDEKINGVEVFSRGIAATENTPMSGTGQAVLLSEEGIVAETHRSGKITESDVNEADLILTMERFHRDWLREKYPCASSQIYLLSEYGNAQEIGDIKDPAGQLADAYHRLKTELQICLTGALKRMREEGLLSKAMLENLWIKADQLTRLKRQRIAESSQPVVPLEKVDADFVRLVGGKGANLGEIARIVKEYGGAVPPALMVTTVAFQRFLEENNLLDAYAELMSAVDAVLENKGISSRDQYEKTVDLLEKIRALILHGRLEPAAGIGREIMEAVDFYGLKNACLSVRSSGLQEDTEEASFAGAAETYLYVNSAGLLECIKKVWVSFWLIRGILYRHDRIIPQGPAKPAVIVQKMFDSQVSGVIFTTDPVSDRDVIVIEAGYGLGEGVVSGLVDVDRYYVNKFDGSVINLHIGKKAFKVMRHPSGTGTYIESVDAALRDAPCLSENDINIQIAMALEEHYALSQDIEFGIDHGKVSILQTRPITTRG